MTDNIMRLIFGLAAIAGFYGFVFLILTKPIPPESKDLANQVMIFATGALGLILGYFFGSSSGSKTKDKAIADSVPVKNLPSVTGRDNEHA